MDKTLVLAAADIHNTNFILINYLYYQRPKIKCSCSHFKKVQQKTTKHYQNLLAKDLKNLFIGMNIKLKVKITIPQTSIDVFSNRTL